MRYQRFCLRKALRFGVPFDTRAPFYESGQPCGHCVIIRGIVEREGVKLESTSARVINQEIIIVPDYGSYRITRPSVHKRKNNALNSSRREVR